jgi:hypothetical protein
MIDVDRLKKSTFHDSSLVYVEKSGDTVILKFEDIFYDDDVYCKVTAILSGVTRMIRNDEPIDSLSMETEDGEVLDFCRSDHTAELLVQWNSYSPSKEEIASYEFEFSSVDLQAEQQVMPDT